MQAERQHMERIKSHDQLFKDGVCTAAQTGGRLIQLGEEPLVPVAHSKINQTAHMDGSDGARLSHRNKVVSQS